MITLGNYNVYKIITLIKENAYHKRNVILKTKQMRQKQRKPWETEAKQKETQNRKQKTKKMTYAKHESSQVSLLCLSSYIWLPSRWLTHLDKNALKKKFFFHIYTKIKLGSSSGNSITNH